MRLKLFLVVTIATLIQVANPVITRAESSQLGGLIADAHSDRLHQRNLANLALSKNSIEATRNIPSATELIAKSKRKSRKPVSRQQAQPIINNPAQEPWNLTA